MNRKEAASKEIFQCGPAPCLEIRKRLQERKWEDGFADLKMAKTFKKTNYGDFAGANDDQNNFLTRLHLNINSMANTVM